MFVGSKFSLLLLSLAFAASLPVSAQNSATSTLKNAEDTKSHFRKAEWAFSMGGMTYEHGRDEMAAAYFYGNVNLDYRFSSWMHAYLAPRINILSSRVQERYDDSGEESRIWMSDGYISYDQFKNFELRAGALSQKFHGTSMLVSGLRSFPGAAEIIKADIGEVQAALIFQQTVPTSHSLNTERATQEKLPSFMTETLQLSGKHSDLIEWRAAGGLYDWSDIPSKVVNESGLVGNVTVGQNVSDSRYLYDHQGWFFASEFCLCPKVFPVGGVIEFERVHNAAAPGNSADAQLIGIGPRIKIKDAIVDIRYRPFFIESDATVASYSKSRFGNTNRIGYNVEVNVHFKNPDFSIYAETYNAEPINRDPNQRDLSMIYFGVETDYVSF